MKYKLINATLEDIEILKEYKLRSIFDYAKDISEEEKIRIINYVDENTQKDISNYKVLIINDKINGCLLVKDYQDGIMLDEIYIERQYRNIGIGTQIIKTILDNNKIVYLYVYKENKAYNLYKKLGFNILEETETRYLMKYIKE